MDGKADPSILETVAVQAAVAASSTPSISRITSISTEEEGRFVPGTLLGGRYRIIGLLGKGGMGEVYRATDLTLGQSVALKFLPPEASTQVRLLERFHAEVRVARQVSHPNVCRVYDIGEVEGMPFLSMEYIDGEDLASLLHRIGRLPNDKAIETARKICAGLAAAHDRGVIHRDLKPQNIMMNKRGEVLIMDFGLAAIADQLTGIEARNGTPAYMAPEQLRGSEVTSKSDIYAPGLVLYELFTGKRPYEGKTVNELLTKQESLHLTAISEVATDVDPVVEKIIRRCLDPDPAKRPSTALSVAAALPGGDPLAAALAAGETPSPEMVAASGKTEGLARRYSIPLLGFVFAVILSSMYYQERTNPLVRASLEYPPAVLAQKSRDIASQFGYTRKPEDTHGEMWNRTDLIAHLKKINQPRKVDEWFGYEAPLRYDYREALSSLYAYPFGEVDDNTPAPVKPGMVSMSLDGHGRLLQFRGVPYKSEQSISPLPNDLFRASKLDPGAFQAEAPTFTPPTASDQVWQWKGKHPQLPNTDLTIEMATWKGQLTHWLVRYPWTADPEKGRERPSTAMRVRGIFLLIASACGALFVLLLARRNWKLGRTDRKGALRLAIVRFLLSFVAWIGTVHAIPNDSMIFTFFFTAAEWLMYGAMVWVLYLALEPALRARWPHSIVTWNRVLSGRWNDAQVAAHVLIGAAVGCFLWFFASFLELFSREVDQLGFSGSIRYASGAMAWISGYATQLGNAFVSGLIVFFVIFGLRSLLKRDYLAAVAMAIIFTFSQGTVFTSTTPLLTVTVLLSIYAGLAWVLLRFGLVATMAAMFYINSTNNIILGSNWRTWFAASSLATLLMLGGIVIWAFTRSLGDRELLGGEVVAD